MRMLQAEQVPRQEPRREERESVVVRSRYIIHDCLALESFFEITEPSYPLQLPSYEHHQELVGGIPK